MEQLLGEFLGTAMLILLGNGVVAGVLLERSKAKGAGWIVITAGWALAVMCGIFTARAAGAPGFVNPVGPIAGLALGKLEPDVALGMVAAELLGAFTGAVLVWLFYLPHWSVTTDAEAKRACFCTSPAIRFPAANVFCEAVGTFVLVLVGESFARDALAKGVVAPTAAALVWAIGLSLGGTTGYAINPARDFAPRLAHALLPVAGKGPSDWSYAWVPIVGPLLGGLAAALLASRVFLAPL